MRTTGMAVVYVLSFVLGISTLASAQDGDWRDHRGRGYNRHGDGRGHGYGYKHGRNGPRGMHGDFKRPSFSRGIYRITEADSVQAKKMKPVLDRTEKRLKSLRASYEKQQKRVMDSLSLQLKPMLKEEQYKRLEDFRYHQEQRRQGAR